MAKELVRVINGYRLNKFVIKADVHDGWMLYNTTTGGLVFIHIADDLNKSLDKLKDMYFYVPLEFDEVDWVNKLRASKSTTSDDDAINGFTVFTTMDCNARCFYCYEKGQPRISMTEKTAKDVAEFIIEKSSNHPVDIRWFGGEPLFNINAIDIICSTMINHGVKFRSTMITNGLLITDSIIAEAKNVWNLKSVQITLDGTKEVYQKAKSYVGTVGDEFERVIDNIHRLSEAKIRVTIRLNQGIYNTPDLLELIDFLSINFKNKERVSVYNSLLFDEDVESDVQLENERYRRFKVLQDKIIKNGLYVNVPLNKRLRYTHCMADSDSSVTITPTGEIGKCEHFANHHSIGNIYDSQFNNIEIQRWKERHQATQKCLDCPLYPQCVQIKMCPVEKKMCSLTRCENKIELIQRALVKEYESFTAKTNNPS